jgi:glucokinase
MMFIGIDLGGSHIGGALVDLDGKIFFKANIENKVGRPQELILSDMIELCKEIINKSGVKIEEIRTIGIGSPGTCDNKRGIIVYDNKLNFCNAPVRAEFEKHFDIPIYIDNDANCAALAESVFGAAKGFGCSITITLGTGVGGGIIIDGKVFSGFNFAGSELGHSIIVVDGEQCTCGRKGCWERYASATGLIALAVKAIEKDDESMILSIVGGDISKIDGEVIFNAAKKGDATAKNIVSEYMKYLAEGIANIINIIMPEVLVIGGGVSKQGNYLLEPLIELVNQKIYVRGDTPKTQLKIAEMENDAGMIGAAMLGR